MSAATAVIRCLIMCLEGGGSSATFDVFSSKSAIFLQIEPSLGFCSFLKLRKVSDSETGVTKWATSHWF